MAKKKKALDGVSEELKPSPETEVNVEVTEEVKAKIVPKKKEGKKFLGYHPITGEEVYHE